MPVRHTDIDSSYATLAPGRTVGLFERIPDRLLAPLSSPNRSRYWEILHRLHAERFGPEAPLPPSIGFPVREITRLLEDELLRQDSWENDANDVDGPETPIAIRAIAVFNHLRDCGWLHIDRHGVREMVTMRPVVSQFLSRLIEFAEVGPVFVAGKIRSIHANLKLVIEGEGQGDTLAEAAQQARQLLEHVRNVGTVVREIMDAMDPSMTTVEYVRRFFGDYISDLFIGDYGELRTREHPLSQRPQILKKVENIQTSDELRGRLLAWYTEHLCKDRPDRAARLFDRDIERLLELRRVDEYLDRLDDEVRRANRRALAFLDYRLRSMRPIDSLIAQALGAALNYPHLTALAPAAMDVLVGPDVLTEPRKQIERPEASPLRKRVISEQQRALSRLTLRMREARSMTPPKLAAFVQSQIGEGESIAYADMKLVGISDVRAAQVLMGLALVQSAGSRTLQLSAVSALRGYLARFTAQAEAEAPFISSTPFEVARNKAPVSLQGEPKK